jgi:HSP20 family protein
MNMRDLIPWGRNQPATPSRYREMNRLFDDVFRGFDMAPLGAMSRMAGWPHVEVVDNDKDVRISAELPGLEDQDVEVLMGDGVLTIRGEKKAEIVDKERAFSERTYGRFERRIPLACEVEEDKIDASFKNGVLTVTLPKSAESRPEVKRIAVNRAGEEIKH